MLGYSAEVCLCRKCDCGVACARANRISQIFRRQHPIGPYVLDFYCAKAWLAIEIDGASHDMDDRPRRDNLRDAWLAVRGITVVRIATSELTRAVEETADAIVRM